MRVRLHPAARRELERAGDYYDEQEPGLGTEFLVEIDLAIETIRELSRAWPLWPNVDQSLGIRRYVVHRFPFAIGYLATDAEVHVYAIAHTSRRPGYWLHRVGARTDETP